MTGDDLALARAVVVLFRRLRDLNAVIVEYRVWTEPLAVLAAEDERADILRALRVAVRRLPVAPWILGMERGV